MDVQNRTFLVTGGSRGLGAALARRAARRGARVVVVARGRDALDETVRAIRAEGGIAHAIVADVGEPSAAARIVAEAAALVGDLDVVVNAASVLGPVPLVPLADTRDDAMAEALAVNFLGAFRLVRAVIGGMSVRGRGVIVNVSSDAGVEAYPEWGAYGATKAALDHVTRTFAIEHASSGVRIFAFDPGEMDTAMHAAAIPGADRAALAQPEDVARILLALVDDASRAPSGARVVAASAQVPS